VLAREVLALRHHRALGFYVAPEIIPSWAVEGALAFSARENADDRAAYTYDVTWSRADGERLTCRDLSPRLVTARIIQAIKTSGPITIHAVEGPADDRAPALVEAAVAEMRERAAKVAERGIRPIRRPLDMGDRDRSNNLACESIADAIRALPTPSQEASNVG
jgi:hypothetical protein